jgi:hypothetical protein
MDSFCMSNKVPRTIPELEQELNDQIELLKLDLANYDAGMEIAAKGIAAKLRVLLHDSRTCHSLLGQIGKNVALFHDTSHKFEPGNVFTYSGLITVSALTHNPKYNAPLDNLPQGSDRQIAFDDWWNAVVFLDKEHEEFSRRDLVLTLADQDGGAHVDPEVEKKYYALTRQNTLGWQTQTASGTWKALSNPHYAAVRQIAHEVLKSLVPGYTPPATSTRATFEGVQIAGLSMGIVGEPHSPPPLPPSRPAQEKVGRNDPCPCGSGKKYKKCHG